VTGGLSAELGETLATFPAAREALDALPPSHFRERPEWVEEAKRPETRGRRGAEKVGRLTG